MLSIYREQLLTHQSYFFIEGRIEVIFQRLRSTNEGPFIVRGLFLQKDYDRVGLGEPVFVHKVEALSKDIENLNRSSHYDTPAILEHTLKESFTFDLGTSIER